MFELREALRFAAFCTLASMSLFLIFFYIVWFVDFVRTLLKLSKDTDNK
jgi:hypothetical protein